VPAATRSASAPRTPASVTMDERWQRILRIMDEAFEDYLSRMAVLRKRVVGDVSRKLSDSAVLNARRGGQPLPEERPPSAARHPRPKRRRPRG